MDSATKACIITAHTGNSWYPKGQQRLINSLVHHGNQWDVLAWNDWPNNNFDKSCPYNIKAAAFQEAINKGYTHILWLDCSAWAIQPVNAIFDIINQQGFYVNVSGVNCAQSCSDKILEYFGVTRDEAELMNGVSSGIMGINTLNDNGAEFLKRFIDAGRNGVFNGSREHDGQSKDPRFLFHRQDQSAASIIFNQLGMTNFDEWTHIYYYKPVMPDTVIFALQGL